MKLSRNATLVLTIGGGVLVLSWLRRPRASVTTSEAFDFSAYGGPTNYPQPIVTFAKAIAHQEGFGLPNAIPTRAHNPGDLKTGPPFLPGTSITQFANDDAGWQALYHQLWIILTSESAHYQLDMTIDQMARTWTATQQGEWSRNVADYLGVPTSTPLWQVLT